jgi:hypothetical protein
MKAFLILFLTCFSFVALADSLEVATGSLTYHFLNQEVSDKYSNKVSSVPGLITNPMLGLRYNSEINSDKDILTHSIFSGQNSIGEFMAGYSAALKANYGSLLLGPVLGFYYQDHSKFFDRGLELQNPCKCDIMPVLGVEFNFIFNLNKDVYFSQNNVITPILSNHTISIGRYL